MTSATCHGWKRLGEAEKEERVGINNQIVDRLIIYLIDVNIILCKNNLGRTVSNHSKRIRFN